MLINLLMAVGMSGWNGFQLGLMGKAVSNLGRVPPYIGVIIIAICLFTLFSLGVNRWNWFVWLTTLSSLSVALVCALIVRNLAQNPEPIAEPSAVGFTTILWAIGTVIAYAALFSLRAPDFSWDLASPKDVLLDGACFLTVLLISGTIGMALYRTTGQWDLSEILAGTNLALLGQLFLIISLVGPALSTIYSGGLAWTNVLPIQKPLIGTLLILAVGIVLGITRFDLRMLPFLDWIGTVTPVALLVMILTQLTRIKSTHRAHLIAFLIGSAVAILTKLSGSQLHLWTGVTTALTTLIIANLQSPVSLK